MKNFYPRSPRGERLMPGAKKIPTANISIHAPREGSDPGASNAKTIYIKISIHAPREGSDNTHSEKSA